MKENEFYVVVLIGFLITLTGIGGNVILKWGNENYLYASAGIALIIIAMYFRNKQRR
jgi:hypothetical protein